MSGMPVTRPELRIPRSSPSEKLDECIVDLALADGLDSSVARRGNITRTSNDPRQLFVSRQSPKTRSDAQLLACVLLFSQQDHRIDGESVPGGDPGSHQADRQHGQDDAAQHDRVFWRGLIDDVGKHTGGEHA